MSDFECGESRAEGALANFISTMRQEMLDKGRSESYKEAFWKRLQHHMEAFDGQWEI